jgi:predicted Zn-dependent protease
MNWRQIASAQNIWRKGYDPQGMLEVVRVLKNQELFDQQVANWKTVSRMPIHGLFSTHPDNDKRLKR